MKKIISIALLVAIVLLSGCAQKAPLKTLKIGVMSDLGATPFVLAKEEGIFKELGLDVELQVFKSAVDRDTALQTGNLDGAMVDMLTVVFFNDADFKIKATSSTYGNYKMVTGSNKTTKELAGLSTIKAGISSNTVIDFATDQIAKAKGFNGQLEKIAIPQMPTRLELLRNGELDVATLPEPLATAAQVGKGEVVASTQDLGLYPGVFIMTDEAIEKMPKEIELLHKGYNKAVDEINATMTLDHVDQIKSTRYFQLFVDKLSFPSVLVGKFVMPTLKQASLPDQESFKTTVDWMKAAKLTQSDYTIEDVSTNQFVK
jgi:NitT/TauT family transport system substrate-binding protein